MLVSKVFEKTPKVSASENMSARLADRVRNIWLSSTNKGREPWEENFAEDPEGIAFFREECMPGLQGIDYIFRWWGSDDLEELAGDLEVLWKIYQDSNMEIYKTTIRFANQDFVMGGIPTESKKREAFKQEFRKAFDSWIKLYSEQLQQG